MKIKWLGVAVVALLVLGMAAGCRPKAAQQAQTAQQAQSQAPISTAAPVDTLSGTLKIGGSTSVQALNTELAGAFMKKHPGVKVQVVGGSLDSGITAVQKGTADIGAVPRVLTAQEMSAFKNYVIALEGVVIIVNPANGVSGLTMDQARQVFDGQITNWQAVGGGAAAIDLFTRERGSGTRSILQGIVMGQDKISSTAGIQNSTEAIRAAVAGDHGGIGYISLGDLNSSVKALSIQGVRPSRQTVFNASYKISRPYFYITKDDPQGLTKAFIDFVLSPEGQAVVAKMKFVTSK